MEHGRTTGAGSNDGDAWHPNGTDDGACLTLAGDSSPQNSPQNVIYRKVTGQCHREREMNRACSTHAIRDTSTLRGGVVEDTTTCHHLHPFPTSQDSRPQRPDLIESVTSFIPQHTRCQDLSHRPAFFKQTLGPSKRGIDRVVLTCLQTQNAQGSPNVSEDVEEGRHCGRDIAIADDAG